VESAVFSRAGQARPCSALRETSPPRAILSAWAFLPDVKIRLRELV
jgi:hypothetical protein